MNILLYFFRVFEYCENAKYALIHLDLFVNRGDVVSKVVLHDEAFRAEVAAERPDVEVNGVFVLLQSVFRTERFAANGALLLLVQTTRLTELQKQ